MIDELVHFPGIDESRSERLVAGFVLLELDAETNQHRVFPAQLGHHAEIEPVSQMPPERILRER